MGDSPAINAAGVVAFVGRFSDGSGLFVGNGTPATSFDGISNYAALSDTGNVAFAGLSGLSWQLAAPTMFGYNTEAIGRHVILRPSITDDGRVVIQAGNQDTSPIRMYSNGLSTSRTIASATFGFTKLGSNPSVTADGKVVTFYGDLSPAGGAILGLDPGPGVFAWIGNGAAAPIVVRAAGVAGNGYLDPGETYVSAHPTPDWQAGDTDLGTIAGFDPIVRASVGAAEGGAGDLTGPSPWALVAYEGLDAAGRKAIYSARISVAAGATGPADASVTDTIQVLAVGGTVHASGGPVGVDRTITDLNIDQAINAKGQIALYANTDAGPEILRADPSREPVLIVPGVGGTFPVGLNVSKWYLNRGLPPDQIAIDPLTHVYDDLILTYQNAGYTQGVNTTFDVSHTGILSNPDVEAAVLRAMGIGISPSKVSVGHGEDADRDGPIPRQRRVDRGGAARRARPDTNLLHAGIRRDALAHGRLQRQRGLRVLAERHAPDPRAAAVKYHYRVTITGSTSWGICDPVGHLLEGAGRMSTDFRTIIGRKDTLSRTNRVNVRASRPAALPQGPARSRSLACSSRR